MTGKSLLDTNYGARNSTHVNSNLERIEKLISENVILACDVITAHYYGAVKYQLKQAGHPIPENDIWISVLALQYEMELISRDVHFDHVATLRVKRI